MSIRIKINEAPDLKKPDFMCDKHIHTKLDNFELTSLLNRSNFTLFLGPPGSGKTTMMISLLNTQCLFKKCFNKIFCVMPSHSRGSLKENIFEQLPPDQLYDSLTAETINEIYDQIEETADEKGFSLLILDDQQAYLKDKAVAKKLTEIVCNRRHLRTSVWCICQTYRSLPKQIRQVLTNLFVWKVRKSEMANIFEEQVELMADNFQTVIRNVFRDPHDFLFIDTLSQRTFRNFDEIILDDDDES